MLEKTILLAEDEPSISRLVKTYFEHDGYIVYTATNGEEAINIFKEIKINLVNYGEKRNMTFYLAKYDKNKSLVSLTPVSKEIDSGGTVSLTVGADASQYSAKLYAMDSLSSLRPIDKAIVLK